MTSSTIPFWRDVPLREIFEQEFGVPVLVETRTRAKAVAEHAEELGKGADRAWSTSITAAGSAPAST